MGKLWYPSRLDVEIVAYGLAARLFRGYGAPLPASSFSSLGFRENPLLESALALPRQPYYRTIYDKAGALLRSMIKNHPFIDGNKRLGMATTSIFMLMNRRFFWPPNDEMVRFALELAMSEPDMPWQQVASWVRQHTLTRQQIGVHLRKAAVEGTLRESPDHLLDWIAALQSTLDELGPGGGPDPESE